MLAKLAPEKVEENKNGGKQSKFGKSATQTYGESPAITKTKLRSQSQGASRQPMKEVIEEGGIESSFKQKRDEMVSSLAAVAG